ncbi:MAG: helix-turn-helix domain-containing protein [Christensenellaceae bacterium]
MLFNEILKGLREERGLTQKNIADACKVSPTCICQLETGSRSPTGSTLLSLADFFNCSIDYLLGREDDFGNITIQTEKPAPLPQDEQELLNIYQALSPAHRSQILEYARYFAEKSGATSTRRKA